MTFAAVQFCRFLAFQRKRGLPLNRHRVHTAAQQCWLASSMLLPPPNTLSGHSERALEMGLRSLHSKKVPERFLYTLQFGGRVLNFSTKVIRKPPGDFMIFLIS